MHRGPTLDDILLKVNDAQYLSLIDASSGYHNQMVNEKPSYLTTSVCQFGTYRYKRLMFGAAPAGDKFHRKIYKLFKDLPKVFRIADDILVVGYKADGRDHDETKRTTDVQTVKYKM